MRKNSGILLIELCKKYFIYNSFKSYLNRNSIETEDFYFFEKINIRFKNKYQIIFQEIICFIKLLLKVYLLRNRKIVAFGGQISLLIFTKVLSFYLGKDYHLYIYNFYLHKLSNYKVVKYFFKIFLKSNKISIIVQCPLEIKYYEQFTSNEVYFVPYSEDDSFKYNFEKVPDKEYIFSGGYTNRDYSLLIKCAEQNPNIDFVFAPSILNRIDKYLPINVTIFKEIDRDSFNGLMQRSKGVILPLKENVGSAGQMVALAAIIMKKPVIYCNVSAINYYFTELETGIPYEIGDLNSLNKALSLLFSPEFEKNIMVEKAYIRYQQNYTLEVRNKLLANIIA
jgi:glycosyltransferase involved in cell wall biosynthesis